MSAAFTIAQRFRGYLPVVIDVETGGLQPKTDALLELAAVFLQFDAEQRLQRKKTEAFHILPFQGARLDPEALKINQIDPYHPFRFALSEEEMLQQLVQTVKEEIRGGRCQRAILVGHNPTFDLEFLQAAANRCKIKLPFHSFICFDTATLSIVAYQETVLAKAVTKAGFSWNTKDAHSAIYDAEKTADLFCEVINRWDRKS